MKTKTEQHTHTPTPWVQKGRDVRGGEYQTEAINVGFDSIKGQPYLMTAHRVSFRVRHEEDAEFIVRAVNSHEALLEAARVAYQYFNKLANTPSAGGYTVAPDSMTRVVLRKLNQAATQAEGGKPQ